MGNTTRVKMSGGRVIPGTVAITTTPTGPPLPMSISFGTAGMGGILGWLVIHPANTVAVRLNLFSMANPTAPSPSFLPFFKDLVKSEGAAGLYAGLGAGVLRQVFYATSRFGLFEVFRDKMAQYRETDVLSRLLTGCASGGIAALISCPCEVSLVRMSNDRSLPMDKRRNYGNVFNCGTTIKRRRHWRLLARLCTICKPCAVGRLLSGWHLRPIQNNIQKPRCDEQDWQCVLCSHELWPHLLGRYKST